MQRSCECLHQARSAPRRQRMTLPVAWLEVRLLQLRQVHQRRPGAGLQLERTNLPTRREVARAEATGELLATLREHDTPRRPRPDARPSRAAPLVCLRLTPDHSTPRALRRVQPDRVLPIPRRLRAQAHGARRCWQRRRNNQQQQQQEGRQEEGYEGSRAAVRER